MQLKVITTLMILVAFGVSNASAQGSINIYADQGGGGCNIFAWNAIPATFYVMYLPLGGVGVGPAITAAEYRITGLQGTQGADYLLSEVTNPQANASAGGSFDGTGVTIEFPSAQSGNIILRTIYLTVLNQNINNDVTLKTEARNPPTNPSYNCPSVTDGSSQQVCTSGGEAFLNSTRDCTVAVEETTWSVIKNLYQ